MKAHSHRGRRLAGLSIPLLALCAGSAGARQEQGERPAPPATAVEHAVALLVATDAGRGAVCANGVWSELAEVGAGPLRSAFVASNGTCWLGGEGKLTRIDAESIATFATAEGVPPAAISAFFVDSGGRTWCATWGAGIAFLDAERWQRVTTDHGLCHDDVNGFANDWNGNLWIATDHGVSILIDGSFYSGPVVEQLSELNVKSIASAADGSIVLGAVGAVLVIRPDLTLHRIDTDAGLPQRTAQALLRARDGTIWAGTWGGGAIGIEVGTEPRVLPTSACAEAGQVGAIAEAPGGDVWLASVGRGLWRRRGSVWGRETTPRGFEELRIVAVIEPRAAARLAAPRGPAAPSPKGE